MIFFILTQWKHFSRLFKQSTCGVCVCVCLCPPTLQAKVCNKATREKGVRPTPTPLHTCMTFLIYHPHFLSLSLCILIIGISDNSKSFFFPNDFEISGLDCIRITLNDDVSYEKLKNSHADTWVPNYSCTKPRRHLMLRSWCNGGQHMALTTSHLIDSTCNTKTLEIEFENRSIIGCHVNLWLLPRMNLLRIFVENRQRALTERPSWAYDITKSKKANEDHYVWGLYLMSLMLWFVC